MMQVGDTVCESRRKSYSTIALISLELTPRSTEFTRFVHLVPLEFVLLKVTKNSNSSELTVALSLCREALLQARTLLGQNVSVSLSSLI